MMAYGDVEVSSTHQPRHYMDLIGQSHGPARYPSDMRLRGPQSRSGCGGKGKNFASLAEI
jgi:hypothetical protein